MSLDKWINFLKPIYIQDNVKRKKIQLIIFFSITFGLSSLLGILLHFKNYIEPESLAGFMMILPLSSVALGKFFTEGKENDRYKFYSLVILLFLIYFLVFTIKSFKLISSNQYLIITHLLILIASLIVLFQSNNLKDFSIYKNHKIGLILIAYFMLSNIIPTIFDLLINGKQVNYLGILYFIILSPFTSFFSIYQFLGEEYGWRGFLQEIFLTKFGKKLGIILIGIIWSMWHWALVLTLYGPETPVLASVVRTVYTIGFAIFFGYAYMKTKNIWLCAMLHGINNSSSIIESFTIDYDVVFTSQHLVEAIIIVSLFYVPFLFTKEFKKDKDIQLNNI